MTCANGAHFFWDGNNTLQSCVADFNAHFGIEIGGKSRNQYWPAFEAHCTELAFDSKHLICLPADIMVQCISDLTISICPRCQVPSKTLMHIRRNHEAHTTTA